MGHYNISLKSLKWEMSWLQWERLFQNSIWLGPLSEVLKEVVCLDWWDCGSWASSKLGENVRQFPARRDKTKCQEWQPAWWGWWECCSCNKGQKEVQKGSTSGTKQQAKQKEKDMRKLRCVACQKMVPYACNVPNILNSKGIFQILGIFGYFGKKVAKG